MKWVSPFATTTRITVVKGNDQEGIKLHLEDCPLPSLLNMPHFGCDCDGPEGSTMGAWEDEDEEAYCSL
uniref:Uncharacterized protein n=1 Tax=Parascaris equorum TaxID=6256 RepID=A0A914RUY7_PAREQ